MSLLVVGTVAFDSVETPFGTREKVLGGSASYLATCASHFCDVHMVGVVGRDFPSEHLDFFKSRNIHTDGIEIADGLSFAWKGRYNENLNVAHTLETHLNVLENFDPKVPDAAKNADVVVLGNFDPSLQAKVLDQIDAPKLVAADTMNFWIDGTPDRLKALLKRVDLLSINDEEARMLSGEYNLVKASRVIRAMGPKYLVIKRGEYGALVFHEDEVMAAPAYPLESVVDPTGAGDSFAGGLTGTLASAKNVDSSTLRQALFAGSVTASFAVEDFSLDRLKKLTDQDIQNRYQRFIEMTKFDGQALKLRS